MMNVFIYGNVTKRRRQEQPSSRIISNLWKPCRCQKRRHHQHLWTICMDDLKDVSLTTPADIPWISLPQHQFDISLSKLSVVKEVVWKARSTSEQGPNGVPYCIYKKYHWRASGKSKSCVGKANDLKSLVKSRTSRSKREEYFHHWAALSRKSPEWRGKNLSHCAGPMIDKISETNWECYYINPKQLEQHACLDVLSTPGSYGTRYRSQRYRACPLSWPLALAKPKDWFSIPCCGLLLRPFDFQKQ